MSESTEHITRLLVQWGQGRDEAREALLPLVYDHLRRIAARQFAGEQSGHTLRPTALVHEAFLQLQGAELDVQNRRHFFALAARTMRNILIDHARARRSSKRGGGQLRVTLEASNAVAAEPEAELLALNEALEALETDNPRVAGVIELSYFGGLTRDEVALELGVSPRTVDRDLRYGRAWLRTQLA